MSAGSLRAALTQTRNAFAAMPATCEGLERLDLDLVRAANLRRHEDLIASAARQGARCVGLGELFSAPYFALEQRANWREFAEDAADGPSVAAMRRAAREHGIVVVAPIYELDARTGGRFNTAVVIEADGSILGKYRKVHIPVGSNERGSFDEAFYYGRSDGRLDNDPRNLVSAHPFFPVFRTSVGALGVAICYDRHFEGVVSTLARGGAELVLSPAVTFGEKSRRMWTQEFAVDAMRHRVFIGGSNRLGVEAPWGVEYFGESHFVGPEGRLPDRSDDQQLIIADLDRSLLAAQDPSGWGLARDSRPDVFNVPRLH